MCFHEINYLYLNTWPSVSSSAPLISQVWSLEYVSDLEVLIILLDFFICTYVQIYYCLSLVLHLWNLFFCLILSAYDVFHSPFFFFVLFKQLIFFSFPEFVFNSLSESELSCWISPSWTPFLTSLLNYVGNILEWVILNWIPYFIRLLESSPWSLIIWKVGIWNLFIWHF